MIEFRLGKSWQREALTPGGPRDFVALELDGVNLLSGANDEPLIRIVDALVETVAGLSIDGERTAQVSLEDVHLELCMWRTGQGDVELSVVDLSTPPRLVHGPARVELEALVEACVRCARQFLRELSDESPVRVSERTSLERHLKRLTSAAIEPTRGLGGEAWATERLPSPDQPFGFSVDDPKGRILAWSRTTRAGLPPLLFGGELLLLNGRRLGVLPFLALMGLARSAAEGPVRVDGVLLQPEHVFRAGLELCLSLRARNAALGTNPYVESLHVRCVDGLRALRQPVPDRASVVPRQQRATPPGLPLIAAGHVRRVRLELRWSREVAVGEEAARIRLGAGRVVVHSPHAVHAFNRQGGTAFRQLASRGIAMTSSGEDFVAATPQRLYGFTGKLASWLRDAEGAQVGPLLESVGEVFITTLSRRALTGLDRTTGRTLWRFEPSRAQRLHVSRLDDRLLAGCDTGTIYGLDAKSGQVRFEIKAGLPVAHAPVAFGRRAAVVLNRGEHTAVYVCVPFSSSPLTPAGTVVWSRELILERPTSPTASSGRLWLAGTRDGKAMVMVFGAQGQLLLERAVPLEGRTLRLVPWAGAVIATDARGAAVRIGADGQLLWVQGALGDELNHALPAQVRRGTVVVPGPVTRLIEPQSGRVVGELETGGRVVDLVTDPRLTLCVLKEPSTLEVWRPSAALGVV